MTEDRRPTTDDRHQRPERFPIWKRACERSAIFNKKITPSQRGELVRGDRGTTGTGGDRDRSLFYRSGQREEGWREKVLTPRIETWL